jgi:tripartite-type tricarboxylate transporter receptor subunit TctC
MKKLIVAVLSCAALAAPLLGHAQAWPTKTVRIIVPHPPGGPGDVPPRGFAQSLSQIFGQPFVVENREGADGMIGAEAAMKSAPDGYTLIATSVGTMVLNVALRKEPTYDVSKFAPIAHTGALQQLILAIPSVPANSMKELLALAKAKPESITVGTFGQVNLANIFVEWAKGAHGIRFYPIPYKSASQGLQSALAGDVQVVSFAMGPAIKFVQSGKLKAMALSPKANPVLPGVPGLRESGADFSFTTWWGWFAPAGTNREIVRRLNVEINKLFADPAFNAKFIASQGLIADAATGGTPEDFEKYIRAETEDFAKLMKLINLKPQ